MTNAVKLTEHAVDRLFEAYDLPLDRNSVHVGVARWAGRNGLAKYNCRLDKKQFGKRMPNQPHESGTHAIVLNERILEQGNRADFIDTIQHELAHIVCYEEHDEYPARGSGQYSSHGSVWKQVARKLGADPSSSHHKMDNGSDKQYFVICPACGKEYGRTKRSKIVKQPFTRVCGECGHSPLSSYERGQEPPTEGGVVKVESLSWNDRQEWYAEGMP